MFRLKVVLFLCILVTPGQLCHAQRYHLFSPEMKEEYPSVVYDFLERYLFELDSLQKRLVDTDPKLRDDKVVFLKGDVATTRLLTDSTTFFIRESDKGFYEVSWIDSLGNVFLNLAFPKQYELLLGMPKVEIEKQFAQALLTAPLYIPSNGVEEKELVLLEDGCFMTQPVSNYYVESLNTATYYRKGMDGKYTPIFDCADKWHSAANLFLGCVDSVQNYTLYIEQNLYGFKKTSYTVPLSHWLGYCESMKLKAYFSVEEERTDGLKALLLVQSTDLGFNHMLSLIIPDNFVEKSNCIIKATLNAYIPTHNVKDLYQQYVEKPRKKI